MATGRHTTDSGVNARNNGEAASHMRPPGALAMTPATPVPGSRIAQAGHVASSPHPDGAVLMDMRTARRTRLNHFGNRVWQSLASRPTLPSLVISLREEGMSAERLSDDVVRLLARWTTQGFVEWR